MKGYGTGFLPVSIPPVYGRDAHATMPSRGIRLKQRRVAIIVPTLFALAGGAVAMYGNIHFLKKPETSLDWIVQLCGALTIGIIIFFIVWGHFQERDPSE
jgi:hypothetical protein